MRTRKHHILRALLILLAVVLFVPAMAQNTRGDRPLDNRGKLRQNEGKTVKKKKKATTKDIAGRRLRTKNKSSANRANVGIPQPPTTSRQPRRQTDRAARVPLDKRYSSREQRRSDPDRQWQGDISGYKPRKIKPASAEESGRNVYPQGKYTSRHPKASQRPFKGYESKTSSGKPIVKRSPKHSERAWRGDIKGQPFYAPSSKTGRIDNVFNQKTRYSKYVTKRPSPRDRSYSNKESVAKAARLGTDTRPKNWRRGGTITATGQAPYVTRGRKNVYWGKMKRSERANTRDLAGRPLQKRNFRSTGIGLVGRDTLSFFGRSPHGDAVGAQKRQGKFLPGSEAKGGWLNDIAGYRLRKKAPVAPGTQRFSGFRSISGKYRNNKPVQGKTPGIGAGAIERGLSRTKGSPGGNYQDQGGAFTGFLKLKRQGSYHGNARGALWNNNGSPIAGKAVPASGISAGRFSGRIRGGIYRNYSDQGGGYTGDLKGRKPYKFAGSSGHKLWNNNRAPVQGKLLPGNATLAGRFSGRIRGGPNKNFSDQGGGYTGDIKGGKMYGDQGEGYTGFLKAKKPLKFLPTAGHKLWNNNGKAVTELEPTRGAAMAGSFQGRKKTRGPEKGKFLTSPNKLWNNDGKAVTALETSRAAALAGTFQGRKKTRGPEKGKFLTSPDKLWNNNGKAVTELETSRASGAAGTFQGRRKTREPEKTKIMSTPNILWNNEGKATTQVRGTKSGLSAGSYQGRTKAKRPEKYPLNSSTVVWNNEGKATTQIRLTNGGARAGSFQGNNKYKKESKDRDADIESRMKMKREYTQNPHSVDLAIKKLKPELNYKAGNFASGAKVVGKRKHNPNSVDDALDSYHNQASARRVDYQGNVKMRKFADHRQSPDAKFVHHGENNVKEDRTIMTNVKLFWAKLFQKSDSQPSNLKDRSNKLRYDKGEKGMWAD